MYPDLLAVVGVVLGANVHHTQCHPCDFVRIVNTGAMQTAGNAISIADRLDFIHIEEAANLIEILVKSFQHADDHEWGGS